MNRRAVLAACLSFFAAVASAWGHPTIDNSMEVLIHPDRISIRAKITLPEIDIANHIDDSTTTPVIDPVKLKTSVEAHGPYLLSHFRVTADGAPLNGKLLSATPPPGEAAWARLEQLEAVYEIDYPLPKPRSGEVRIEHDLLKEFSRLGQPWVVMFVVQARQSHESAFTQLLLTADDPLEIECTWPTAGATTTTSPPATAPPEASRSVAIPFAIHGFEHIITGYDHLLFVAALVLASSRLMDLVKVVTAFAIAHTLTLTLSVLGLVRLPSSVVEPIIAASIVFVALQNVIFPQQSRGSARLVVAFVFGLFHGLGFAGGLLTAMAGMPAANLAVALIAFTVGVEVAHQVLIVPLYFLLRPLRHSRVDAPADRVPRAALTLRAASLLISLAGAFYLVQALRRA